MNLFERLFARNRLYADLNEEMQQHLDERIEELVKQGMPRERAAATARREFGNLTAIEERGREAWKLPIFDSFVADVRYALRHLRQQPSFSIVAILILALGIGANTTVFSVIRTLLFEPLPFRAPGRLVWIINQDTPGLSGRTHRVDNYEAFAKLQSFEEMTTYEAFFARSSYKLAGDTKAERVAGVMIAPNFLPFLGVKPAMGRSFTDAESKPGAPGVVILSHALWQSRYSSDPNIVGRQLTVNDRGVTIVGVMPASFDFGSVFAPGLQLDLFMPTPFAVIRNWGNTVAIIGRLKPGVSLAAAQAEANAMIEVRQREHREFGPPRSYGAILQPMHDSVTAGMRQPMLLLWAAVGVVLLIVCVNLSNLLLARAAVRRKEMALRRALGANGGRLARQMLTETFVLAVLGGALGVALSYAATSSVRRFEALSIPLLKSVQIDLTSLAVAAGVTLLTALLFGFLPAISAARGDLGEAMKDSARGSSQGRSHLTVRAALVVSEVAFACLLLVGAGLLLRSFLHVLDVKLGFDAGGTYTLRLDAPQEGTNSDEKIREYQAQLRRFLSNLREVPGIDAASITDAVPLESNRTWGLRAKDDRSDAFVPALVKVIGPGLLHTMKTPLISGREFSDFDDDTHPRVAIINQSLATRLFPNADPLHKLLRIVGRDWEVIGVAADVRHLSVEESAGGEFYLSLFQMGTGSPTLVVRTHRGFDEVAPALRKAIAQDMPGLPTDSFRALNQTLDRALSPRRFLVNLLIAFAMAALLLAAIGIYGVIAYSVARRTPEFGIRMALGATGSRIRGSVVAGTLRLAVIGVVIGIAAAVPLSALLTSMLFGVSAKDTATFTAAGAILLLVALAAGFIPAFRASRISPMTALRAE
ncbi:MAG: ABC transporter permease [Acidobacteriota bacterium]